MASHGAQYAAWLSVRKLAIRAHQICNLLRIAHPEIGELSDDGCLHEAIHDLMRVDWPVEPTSTPIDQFSKDMDNLLERMEAGQPYSTDETMLALAEQALAAKVDVSPEEWAERLLQSMERTP